MCAYPPFEMQNSSDVAHFVLKIFGFAQFEVKSLCTFLWPHVKSPTLANFVHDNPSADFWRLCPPSSRLKRLQPPWWQCEGLRTTKSKWPQRLSWLMKVTKFNICSYVDHRDLLNKCSCRVYAQTSLFICDRILAFHRVHPFLAKHPVFNNFCYSMFLMF